MKIVKLGSYNKMNAATINIPIYGQYTDIVYFPAPATHPKGKCSLLTNDPQTLQHSGSYLSVPYLPGHDYVLLPRGIDGECRVTYSTVVPSYLQSFRYLTELKMPEVVHVY